jgi:hypothetical protein
MLYHLPSLHWHQPRNIHISATFPMDHYQEFCLPQISWMSCLFCPAGICPGGAHLSWCNVSCSINNCVFLGSPKVWLTQLYHYADRPILMFFLVTNNHLWFHSVCLAWSACISSKILFASTSQLPNPPPTLPPSSHYWIWSEVSLTAYSPGQGYILILLSFSWCHGFESLWLIVYCILGLLYLPGSMACSLSQPSPWTTQDLVY